MGGSGIGVGPRARSRSVSGDHPFSAVDSFHFGGTSASSGSLAKSGVRASHERGDRRNGDAPLDSSSSPGAIGIVRAKDPMPNSRPVDVQRLGYLPPDYIMCLADMDQGLPPRCDSHRSRYASSF